MVGQLVVKFLKKSGPCHHNTWSINSEAMMPLEGKSVGFHFPGQCLHNSRTDLIDSELDILFPWLVVTNPTKCSHLTIEIGNHTLDNLGKPCKNQSSQQFKSWYCLGFKWFWMPLILQIHFHQSREFLSTIQLHRQVLKSHWTHGTQPFWKENHPSESC